MIKWILGAASLATLMQNKVASIQDNIRFEVRGIKLSDFDFTDGIISLKVDVINGNDMAIPITAFNGELTHDGYLISRVRNAGTITLPAKGTKGLVIKARMQHNDVIDHLTRLIGTGGLKSPLVLSGDVSLGERKIHITREFQVVR